MPLLNNTFGKNNEVGLIRELPVTSLDKVPKSKHPNAGICDGRDYTDPEEAVRVLTAKSPKTINHFKTYLSGYYRDSGVETEYGIYRIAESTWRVVGGVGSPFFRKTEDIKAVP